MRSLLVERFQAVRGIPPENEELKQQVQDMSARVQATQAMASRTAAMGSAVQNDLNNVANLAGANTPPTTTPPTTTPPTTSTTSSTATRPIRPNQSGKSLS